MSCHHHHHYHHHVTCTAITIIIIIIIITIFITSGTYSAKINPMFKGQAIFNVIITPFCKGRSSSNQTAYLGETVELKCDALEGKTVRWSKEGAILQTKTAGYGTSLLINSIQQGDAGVYTCEVINSTGLIQASYIVTLTVEST